MELPKYKAGRDHLRNSDVKGLTTFEPRWIFDTSIVDLHHGTVFTTDRSKAMVDWLQSLVTKYVLL